MGNITNIEGGLKGHPNTKVIEKTKYKGELRILGIINDSSKKTIGYVIFVEKTFQNKSFTIEQTKELLKRFKFSNAQLDGDKIVNTECSMDKLYKYLVNPNGQMICNDTRKTIIGQLMFNNEKIGYKLTDCTGRVISIKSAEINSIIKNSINNRDNLFVNASVKEVSANSYIVSAIKEPFTTIEVVKGEEAKQIEKSPNKQWRLDRRLYKVMFKYLEKVRKLNRYPSGMKYYKEGYCVITNVPTGKGVAYGKYEIQKQIIKDLNLIADELFSNLKIEHTALNVAIKDINPSDEDYVKANRGIVTAVVMIMDALLGTDKNKTFNLLKQKDINDYRIKTLVAEAVLCKNSLMNKFSYIRFCSAGKESYTSEAKTTADIVEYYKEILNAVPRTQFIKSFVVEMTKAEEYLPCTEEAVHRISKNSEQLTCNYQGNAVLKMVKREKPEFKYKEFKTSQQIAQLGFTLYRKYDGKEFKHDTMVNKPLTLRYICNNSALRKITSDSSDVFIDNSAEDLIDKYIASDLCTCFGDIATISLTLGAYAAWLRNDKVDIPKEMSAYSVFNKSKDDLLVLINIYLTMLSIYNMPLLRAFYKTPFIKDMIEKTGEEVPYIEYFEEINKEDFDLPERLRLYYESGYNVYYKEGNEDKLINLRSSLGSYGKCKHSDIANILASVLMLNIKADSATINDLVGNLRYYYYNKN